MSGFDLITMGRVGVDLYPNQSGVTLDRVTSFSRFLGGSATNVAVAAARYGARAAVITKVGDDAFGTFVRDALDGFGVDPRWVGTDPDLRTPVVFCEIHPPDDFPLLFYREPQAPDMMLRAGELDLDQIRAARIFWTTGTGLSAEPSREATLAALGARDEAPEGAITIHDLDHRPMFWDDPAEATRYAREALAHVDVAVGNRDEVEVATGSRDPEEAAMRLLELGVGTAIIKRGPEGVYVRTADREFKVPPIRVDVVNGLGAGDAFGGALARGLLDGDDLQQVIERANAAGAYVSGRLACADAMPDRVQLDDFMAEAAR
jgi:5-dehydro-2-deoxygluconokinase